MNIHILYLYIIPNEFYTFCDIFVFTSILILGTGKTLVARALANECSTGEKKVAFFMRKGADCLSKWVGESERQLRLLFDQVCVFIFHAPTKLYIHIA